MGERSESPPDAEVYDEDRAAADAHLMQLPLPRLDPQDAWFIRQTVARFAEVLLDRLRVARQGPEANDERFLALKAEVYSAIGSFVGLRNLSEKQLFVLRMALTESGPSWLVAGAIMATSGGSITISSEDRSVADALDDPELNALAASAYAAIRDERMVGRCDIINAFLDRFGIGCRAMTEDERRQHRKSGVSYGHPLQKVLQKLNKR
jgi:hypothetical protein